MTAVASADITRLADALRKSGQDSRATTQRVMIESANFLLTEMEVRAPVRSGELRRSLGVRVEADRVIVGPDVPYASYVEFGTKPHEIRPKNPNGVLVFSVNGQKVFAKVVHHPGTKANPFVQDSFDAWVATLGPAVAEANVKVITDAAS